VLMKSLIVTPNLHLYFFTIHEQVITLLVWIRRKSDLMAFPFQLLSDHTLAEPTHEIGSGSAKEPNDDRKS
ncbi:hypothetical protein, partial [Marivivens sp.]|uniref:hypothetical protein n=1 Tax=Marivivens sp. TaxID=1978374 RepID=UPI0025BC43E1